MKFLKVTEVRDVRWVPQDANPDARTWTFRPSVHFLPLSRVRRISPNGHESDGYPIRSRVFLDGNPEEQQCMYEVNETPEELMAQHPE